MKQFLISVILLTLCNSFAYGQSDTATYAGTMDVFGAKINIIEYDGFYCYTEDSPYIDFDNKSPFIKNSKTSAYYIPVDSLIDAVISPQNVKKYIMLFEYNEVDQVNRFAKNNKLPAEYLLKCKQEIISMKDIISDKKIDSLIVMKNIDKNVSFCTSVKVINENFIISNEIQVTGLNNLKKVCNTIGILKIKNRLIYFASFYPLESKKSIEECEKMAIDFGKKMLGANNVYSDNEEAFTTGSAKVVLVGGKTIYLPNLEGLTECSENFNFKSYFAPNQTEKNISIGYYVPDSVYQKQDSLQLITFDGYIKVYYPVQLTIVQLTEKQFNEGITFIMQEFETMDWQKLKSNSKFKEMDIDFGSPKVISSNKIRPNHSMFTLLTTITTDNTKELKVIVMNIIHVNSKMIMFAYYKDYFSEEDITEAEEFSEKVAQEFLKINAKYNY